MEEMTKFCSFYVLKVLKSLFPADLPTTVLTLTEMAFTVWVQSTWPQGIWKTSQ